MANLTELFLGSYDQLTALSEKQVSIADKERYDEQLTHIQELEEQKKNYQIAIEQISHNESEYALIIAEHRSEIIAYIQQLQALNNQLQQMINGWYSEDSKTMKQVSVHRKTLQSYGGVNNSDVISYYFDEKQ